MIDKFKKKMKDEVGAYLTAMLGGRVDLESLSAVERKRAGWLVNFYALKVATIRDKKHVLAFAKPGQHYTPVAVAKQLVAGREALGLPMVYVPRELGPHDISRLIAANVPYVLPQRSLFLPEAGLSVTHAPDAPVLRETFSVPAQLLVLGAILRKWDGTMTLSDGMERSGFSSASVVHAFQEIVHFGAGERVRGSDGRTVRIQLMSAHEIWGTCRHRFFNPCKRTAGVISKPDGAVLAGVDALAKMSALNESAPTCFAMPLKGFRALGIEELSPASAPCKLQLWHYPPTALGGDVIDPASLYLSLRSEPDDRVQIELDKLLETFKW